MAKMFYTENDIDQLHAQGATSLDVMVDWGPEKVLPANTDVDIDLYRLPNVLVGVLEAPLHGPLEASPILLPLG